MHVNDTDLEIIADQLNGRPRKSLGYATSNEIFNSNFGLSTQIGI